MASKARLTTQTPLPAPPEAMPEGWISPVAPCDRMKFVLLKRTQQPPIRVKARMLYHRCCGAPEAGEIALFDRGKTGWAVAMTMPAAWGPTRMAVATRTLDEALTFVEDAITSRRTEMRPAPRRKGRARAAPAAGTLAEGLTRRVNSEMALQRFASMASEVLLDWTRGVPGDAGARSTDMKG